MQMSRIHLLCVPVSSAKEGFAEFGIPFGGPKKNKTVFA